TKLISTLLFSVLPLEALSLAIGLSSPYPMADNLKASIPFDTKYSITERALDTDRFWFNESLPTVSVCPSTENLAVGYSFKIVIMSTITEVDSALMEDFPVSNKIVLA